MTDPRSPLIDAAASGDVARMRELLAAGADPNERQVHEDHVDRFTVVDFVVTPLLAALRRGRSEVALLLLERGASIDERDARTTGTRRSRRVAISSRSSG